MFSALNVVADLELTTVTNGRWSLRRAETKKDEGNPI